MSEVMILSLFGVFWATLPFLIWSFARALTWTPIISFHYIDPLTSKPTECVTISEGGQKFEIVTGHIAIGFNELDRKLAGKWAEVKVPAAPWMRRLYIKVFRKEIRIAKGEKE